MKIIKKFIWLFIFIIIMIVALIFVFKVVLKLQFNDDIKYKNINYTNSNICLSFNNNNSYNLDDCNGGSTELKFNSSDKCTINYSKDYNSFIFNCGLNNINLVKLNEFSFNKIKFIKYEKDYTLINTSLFSTMDGLQKISFNFIDEKNIKFTKYINNNLVDEEVCPYTYAYESMGLECNRFYGFSSFILEKYDGNNVTFSNRGSKINFTLSD